MIDTIVFKIEAGNHSNVFKEEFFSPEFNRRTKKNLSPTELKEGHTKAYLRQFILRAPKENGYIPRVKIWEKLDGFGGEVIYEMRIELSIPKLMFGNNLQELSEHDMNDVCTKIKESLAQVKIKVMREAIRNAPVSVLHLGKNFLLPEDIHPHEIVDAISKTETTKAYDGARERYGNDGSLARIRSGSREDLFYDKVKDMQKPKSKALDKEGKDMEKAFLETYALEKVNILRYEHRFARVEPLKSEVNAFLNRDYQTKVLFSDVFNENLWRHILQKTWGKLYKKPANQTLFRTLESEPMDIARHIMRMAHDSENVVHSQNTALISFGLAMLIREFGADMVRSLCLDVWSEKTCGLRMSDKIKTAEKLLHDLPVSDAMSFIDAEMHSFKCLTLASFDKYRII